MDLSFEPGSIKEPYECKRQHYQQKDNAGEQDNDAEHPPSVALKSDVTKAKGAHYCESPIETRYPGVFSPFNVEHDEVKEDRENENYREQKHQILNKRAHILADLCLAEEVCELSGQKLHGSN